MERVASKLFINGDTEELPMEVLKNLQYDEELHTAGATHIITKVQYGASAIFDFSRKWDSFDLKKERGGKLEGALESLESLTGGYIGGIKGGGGLEINDNKEKASEGFKCTYRGNIPVTKFPNDYKSSIAAIQEILTKVNPNAPSYIPKPQIIWLQPLSEFNNDYKNIKADVEESLLSKCVDLTEDVSELLLKANDLVDDATVTKYPHFIRKARKFKTIVNNLNRDIKQKIAELIVEVRKGNGDAGLNDFLDNEIKQRSFNLPDLRKWHLRKKKDKSVLSKFLADLEDVYVVSDAGEHIQRRGRLDVCLIIKMRSTDPYLDSKGESYIEQSEYFTKEEEFWKKVEQFRNFIKNNAVNGFTFHVKPLNEEDAVFDCYFEIWRADRGKIENKEVLPNYLNNFPIVQIPALRNMRAVTEPDSHWIFWEIPENDLRTSNIDPNRGVKNIEITIEEMKKVGKAEIARKILEIAGENIIINDKHAQIFGLSKHSTYEITIRMITEFGPSPKTSLVMRY